MSNHNEITQEMISWATSPENKILHGLDAEMLHLLCKAATDVEQSTLDKVDWEAVAGALAASK